jgi:hypothetical protein
VAVGTFAMGAAARLLPKTMLQLLATHSREIAGMTAFELYALFGSPLLLLLWALLIVWLTGLQDNKNESRRIPSSPG